jgi:ParB family chromosome partitioning protein
MAGERRWLASQRAGKLTIPAIVKQVSDEQAMEITIIENLQREDLNPLEQARAFERLSREFGLTQELIAIRTGKDRATVANFMRLLKLPAMAQSAIEDGTLSLGHGKILMMLTNEPSDMVVRVAQKAIDDGMSVRQLEEMVQRLMGPARGVVQRAEKARDPNVRAAEQEIQRTLGCKVSIRDSGGKGKIVLEYASLEEFDRIVEVLGEK